MSFLVEDFSRQIFFFPHISIRILRKRSWCINKYGITKHNWKHFSRDVALAARTGVAAQVITTIFKTYVI